MTLPRLEGRIAAAAIVLCALLASGPLPAAAEAPAQLRSLIAVGEKAPGFSLKTLEGKPVAFRPGDGKPALIVFWSISCPVCRELTPMMNDISRKYASEVRMVSVNLDGPRFSNAVRSYIKENRLAFPVGLDDIRGDLFIASDPYGVEHTPTAVVVDGAGKVRGVFVSERVRDLVKNFDGEIAPLRQTAKKGSGGKK